MTQPLLSVEILDKLNDWINAATLSEMNDPTAMCLSTIGTDQMPDSRMVLARIIDERGLAFFTNYHSKKGADLLKTPKASLCFHWKSLRKQIRMQGMIEPTSTKESDDYYNSRARESRIGAWASLQSTELPSRATLMERVKFYEDKFKDTPSPPRPEHWSGFRIIPHKVEFWQDGEFRLHERELFTWQNNQWIKSVLYP
jgi:pyridoxamine 5'-phosphate oxidase